MVESYPSNRHFFAKYDLYPIQAGVSQGNVLRPALCLLYTADLPSDFSPIIASRKLQTLLNRIKVNETKSTHITFTIKSEICHPVTLNGQQLFHADYIKYVMN